MSPLPPYVPPESKPRRKWDYKCEGCKQSKRRWELVVKRVVFAEMGTNGKVLRSRTKKWLCKPCMEKDPDYNLKAREDTPGHRQEKR